MKLYRIVIFACCCLITHFAAAQYFDCKEELFPKQDKNTRLWGYVNHTGEYKIEPSYLKAYRFDGPNAVVFNQSKFGMINCEGYLTVPYKYDAFENFVYGNGWAQAGGMWGLIDNNDKPLTKFQFSAIKTVVQRQPLTWVQENNLWGLYHKDINEYLIKPQYKSVQQISDSVALLRFGEYFRFLNIYTRAVKIDSLSYVDIIGGGFIKIEKKGKSGLANAKGGLLVPCRFDSVSIQKPIIKTYLSGKIGLYGVTGGKISEPVYDYVGNLREGYIPVRKGSVANWINPKGATVINKPGLSFTATEPVIRGRAVAATSAGSGLFSLRTGQWLISPVYKKVIRNPNLPLLLTYSANNKAGLVYEDGKPYQLLPKIDTLYLSDPPTLQRLKIRNKYFYFNTLMGAFAFGKPYTSAAEFQYGYAVAADSSGTGLINQKGGWVIQPNFSSIKLFYRAEYEELWAVTVRNQLSGLVNISKNAASVLGNDFEQLILNDGRAIKTKKNGQWGLYNYQGKELITPQFDDMLSGNQLAKAQPEFPAVIMKGGKFGLMDIKGNLYQKPVWDAVKYAGSGKWLLVSGGLTSLANERGEVQGADKFEETLDWGDKCIGVRKGKVWGFVGADGKWLYEPQFEEVRNYRGRSALVKLNGKWGAVDRNGTVVEPFIHIKIKTLPNGVDLLD